METESITRAYLETLSFSDLLEIADNFGIDVPEHFNRVFLIGEILECAEEAGEAASDAEMVVTEETLADDAPKKALLPYNSTEVDLVLRNPVWAFVYWNISSSDREALEAVFMSRILLRVNSFSDRNQQRPDDFFEIQISKEDDGQYVLLPAGRKFFRVDLLFNLDGVIDILASSRMLEMPRGGGRLADMRSEVSGAVSPVMELSGLRKVLQEHFEAHRESFS
ncbi:MAG: DUF4912 domain-containing protein [Treponemataceae bacterium]|nr:DUF4912 domain-containing protein [Treponemataceae bacterium]